jgi:hypothetical protein
VGTWQSQLTLALTPENNGKRKHVQRADPQIEGARKPKTGFRSPDICVSPASIEQRRHGHRRVARALICELNCLRGPLPRRIIRMRGEIAVGHVIMWDRREIICV